MTQFYQSQRNMRMKRQAALQRGLVAILDIGTTKVACLVLRFEGDPSAPRGDGVGNLVGQGNFRVIGAATTRSRGVQFGEIYAMRETECAVRTVLQAAQKMAGHRVDHVIASFSGGRPRSYGLEGKLKLAGTSVQDGDVARVIANCDVPDYGAGRDAVHAQPINFALDHRSGLADPRGQIGNNLSVDMHLLTVDSDCISNVLHCLKRCDLDLAGIASSAYASGMASLVEDEQELGAACIDLGGGSTGVSIFFRKHMIYSDSVRMGGMHVTSDISQGLQVSTAMAERLKTFHGGVLATGMDDRERISIGGNTGDWDHDQRTVSRAELIGIIKPRVEEILEEARALLDAAGFEYLPGQRIVLTGGGSQLPGLDDLASRILGPQVRLGRPMRIRGLPQAATGPAFSASVGLALFAAYPQDEWWDFDVPSASYGGRSIRRAVRWFRENW